jgi:hypothetical protein
MWPRCPVHGGIGYCSLSNGSISPTTLPNEGKDYLVIIFQPLTLAAWLSLTVGKAKGSAILAFLAIEVAVDASERMGAYLIDVYAKDEEASRFLPVQWLFIVKR